mgnify:CR=1 FL=1
MIEINLSETGKILDLGVALAKETLHCNRLGACMASSSILCNTRSWHGMLSIPDDNNGGLRVLLSNTDDCLISNGRQFYICTRKYPNLYHPTGHQFIYSLTDNPIPQVNYQIGNIRLKKEVLLCQMENTVLIRYTFDNAEQPVVLQIRPLVAFRNADNLLRLRKEQLTGHQNVRNGILYKPAQKGLQIFMQTSIKSEFVTAPDWNYNVEYIKDQADGRQYQEDLFMPGFFEVVLTKGSQLIFSASAKRQSPSTLNEMFDNELMAQKKRIGYGDELKYLANQFVCQRKNRTYIITGFPDTKVSPCKAFRAAPGLLLSVGNVDGFLSVLNTMQAYFRVRSIALQVQKMEPETPFWFLWALQQLYFSQGNAVNIFNSFEYIIKRIVQRSSENTLPGIYIGEFGAAKLENNDEKNYISELNALIYNGLMFAADLSLTAGKQELSVKARMVADRIKDSFRRNFEDSVGNTIACQIKNGIKDFTTCPAKLLPFALPYSVANAYLASPVLAELEDNLLTPYGLRMLSPCHPNYSQETGYVVPQYSGFLAELYLRIYGANGIDKAEKLYLNFDPCNGYNGNLICEKYDGTPPYTPDGAVIDSVAVAEIVRIKALIDKYKKTVIIK